MKSDDLLPPENRTELLAGFYGLILRNRGYSPAEAAEMVIRCYPSTKKKLESLCRRRPVDPLNREEELLRRAELERWRWEAPL